MIPFERSASASPAGRRTAPAPPSTPPDLPAGERRPGNDVSAREGVWRRHAGDDWAAFEALPPAVRARLHAHAYDAWAVNALMLWRMFRRRHGNSARAERALLRYLDRCEFLECDAFASSYSRAYGAALPHVAAGVSVLRGGARGGQAGMTASPGKGTGR